MRLADYLVTLISFARRKNKRPLIKIAYALKHKKGLEIGGPSNFFKVQGGMPVYLFARVVDGVNFSSNTIWEGSIQQGNNYKYTDDKAGYQYIAEGSDLSQIPADSYDFLLSCHSLEHVANPIKAVFEWARVLKKGGELILILPDKDNTFDHRRPYTTFEHLVNDYNNNIGEEDTTHFEEVLQLHDEQNISAEEFKKRVISNMQWRSVHHHVFSFAVVSKMLEYCGFTVAHQQKLNPFHLITCATKN